MAKEGLTPEMLEMLQRVEKESRFWQKLRDIGFERLSNIAGMESVKHYALPIHHSFYLDVKKLEIEKLTIDDRSWVRTTDGSNVMSGENFIKYMIHRVRKMTGEILNKLDNVTL
jgi:hypothetical protein